MGEDDIVALIQPGGSSLGEMRLTRQGRDLLDQLDRCAWDLNEVARELGVHRATVYRRLRRLGISEPGARDVGGGRELTEDSLRRGAGRRMQVRRRRERVEPLDADWGGIGAPPRT